ncbi:hypothetical protein FHW37_104593 [Neorhizobium alkalisoli]|uniref:Rap1a immunity protein domain-containing protein n=1 Tax=Neorhizobium alkalisoli TaxID=528178 RepID=A0A561QSG3_9HYPH|nr:hypothetical protein FHW37_104593 [Neorhizobium alkalisoli]
MRLAFTLACAGIFAAWPLAAQGITVGATIEKARTDLTAKLMINAAGDTIVWVSAYLDSKKRGQLVCPPPRLVFTPETYVSVLSGYVSKHPEGGKESLQMLNYVMLNAMLYTFPCRE